MCHNFVKQDGKDAYEFLFGPFSEELGRLEEHEYVHVSCYEDAKIQEGHFSLRTLEDIFGVM